MAIPITSKTQVMVESWNIAVKTRNDQMCIIWAERAKMQMEAYYKYDPELKWKKWATFQESISF